MALIPFFAARLDTSHAVTMMYMVYMCIYIFVVGDLAAGERRRATRRACWNTQALIGKRDLLTNAKRDLRMLQETY